MEPETRGKNEGLEEEGGDPYLEEKFTMFQRILLRFDEKMRERGRQEGGGSWRKKSRAFVSLSVHQMEKTMSREEKRERTILGEEIKFDYGGGVISHKKVI